MTYNLKLPRFPQNISLTALPVDNLYKSEIAKDLAKVGLESENFNPQFLLEASEYSDANSARALHEMLKVITSGKTLPIIVIDSDDLGNLTFWGSIETSATRSMKNAFSPVIVGGSITLSCSMDLQRDLYANSLHALSDVRMNNARLEQIFCRNNLRAATLDVDGDITAESIGVVDSVLSKGKITATSYLVASRVVCDSAFIGASLYGNNRYNRNIEFKAYGKNVVVGGTCHAGAIEVPDGNFRARRVLGDTVKVASLNVVEDIELQTLVAKQVYAKIVKVEELYDVGTLECEELKLGPNVKFSNKFYTGEPIAQYQAKTHSDHYPQG